MAGLTFVLEPRCSHSEPLVHSLCGDGPRLTLTPQGRSWGTESPPRSSGSYTGWSHGQTLSCPATKQIKNLLPELLVCGLKKESIIVLHLHPVIICNTVDIYMYFDWPHSVWLCIFPAGCWVLFWGPLFLPPLQRVPVSPVDPCPVWSSALAACLGISSQKLASDVHVKNGFNHCSLMSGYKFNFPNNKLYQSTKHTIVLPTTH